MKNVFYISYVILILVIEQTQSKNILVLEGVPSPSHHYWIRTILLELTALGHNITSLTSDNVTQKFENLHYIHMESVYDALYNDTDEGIDFFEMGELNPWMELLEFYDYGFVTCKSAIQSKGWQQLLDYPNDFKFDLVLHDFLTGPCLLAVMDTFKYPPLILMTAFNDLSFTSEVIGTILTTSISPPCTSKYFAKTFLQRTDFFLLHFVDHILRNTYYSYGIQNIVRTQFPNLPRLDDIQKQHTRLILLNNDPSVDLPEQFPPNVIKVGGLQIKKTNRLPENLLKIMETAKKGVILFSLGTNVRSDMLRSDILISILETFSEMNDYTFIWKFESDDLTMKIPSNVHILEWIPQSDLLAHPNMKLFITHAGLLSTQESTWHGVPMLGIPIFADQFMNIEKSIRSGVAERLYLKELTKNNFKTLIEKLLTTPSYHENMKIRSQNFRDQKDTPLERAIWWIEWVLRNPNATHFESPAKNMNYLQRQSIDVIAFLTICFVTIILLIMGCMYCLCFKNKKNVIKKKNE